MIYFSTGGFKNYQPSKVVNLFIENNIYNIELSGGIYEKDILKKLKKLPRNVNAQIHNYFPPPKFPFVLNLASFDKEISSKTINHIKYAINFSSELNSSFYSFHAGFLIDPKPDELGRKIVPKKLSKRKDAIEIFTERLNALSIFAERKGVNLLVENNVLSRQNLINFKTDPLLMTHPDECSQIMKQTPDNINMLLDFAHLKVSAKSLQFEPNTIFKKCSKWIKAYHLSDNNGLSDSNDNIKKDSWFMKNDYSRNKFAVIEVYTESFPRIKNQIKIVEDNFYNN